MTVSVVSNSGGNTYTAGGGGAGVVGGGWQFTWNLGGIYAPGDLGVVIIASSRQYASVSTGWTQIASIGSASSWLAAFYRVLDGTSNDTCTVVLSSSGSLVMDGCAFHSSTYGFDTTCVRSHSENVVAGSAGATYALAAGLTGVVAGDLSVCFGGDHNATTQPFNGISIIGTGWGTDHSGGQNGPTGAPCGSSCGTNSGTGTIGVPSASFTDTTDSFNKFIFAACIRDAAAPSGGLAGGLLWGM